MKKKNILGFLACAAVATGFFYFSGNTSAQKLDPPGKVSRTQASPETNAPQALPFSQDWTNTGLITTNDDWSGVPGIQGFLGQDMVTTTGADARNILAPASLVANDLDVIANQTNPDTLASGGVAEFDGIANPSIALNGSGTADVPHLVLYLNTTGNSNIRVQYDARDLDASADNSIQQINTQYRVGNTGNFINVPGGYIADASGGPSTATLVTHVDVTLPAAANNQPEVQVRIMSTNAAGNDEWIGIDNILVNTAANPAANRKSGDFDGDGRSDFGIVRNVTPPPLQEGPLFPTRPSINELVKAPGFRPVDAPSSDELGPGAGSNLAWFISNSLTGTSRVQTFGQPTTDFWIPEDFDGDGRDDLAVWRGVAASGPNGGFFFIFRSSNSTVSQVDFGIQGDNPTVAGDYDGDRISDPAVFRCPVSPPGGQCTFFYRGSMNNPGGNITHVQWGNNASSNVRPYPGDFDGDGKYDFCTFRNGQYVLLRTSDGGVEWINWGLSTDPVLAPGDYDGDGKADFMNVRVGPGNSVEWWQLNRNGGQSTTVWGALIGGFTEFVAQGDYDGDGRTDITVWRRNNSGASGSFFYVLRSSNQTLSTFEWGSMNDAPIPGWNDN